MKSRELASKDRFLETRRDVCLRLSSQALPFRTWLFDAKPQRQRHHDQQIIAATSHTGNRKDVARIRREVELPVHSASAQHQRTSIEIAADSAIARDGAIDDIEEVRWVLMRITQVDGKEKVMYALTKIKGVGRRYSNLVCKKADVDLNKRYISPRHTHYANIITLLTYT